MNMKEKIQFYLKNTDALYKEWHLKQIQHETGVYEGVHTGALGDAKKAFDDWLKSNMAELRKVICPNMPKIRSLKNAVDIVSAITSLIEELAFVGGVTEAASLLFVYGIEKLCKANES
jgi:hypothetical protein